MMLSPLHPASLIASGGRDQDTIHIKSQTDDIDLDCGVRDSDPSRSWGETQPSSIRIELCPTSAFAPVYST